MIIPVLFDIVTIPSTETTVLIVRVPTSEKESATLIEPIDVATRSEEKAAEAIGKAMSAVIAELNGWSGKGAETRKALISRLVDDYLSK